MEKSKKILTYFVFTFIIMISGINNVSADVSWPGVSSNSLPGEYANMEYCVYNTDNVYTAGSDFTSVSKYYSDTNYILIYDNTNNEIKFLNKDGTVRSTLDKFAWDSGGLGKQYIYFSDKLYDYLVEDGIFTCKSLIFLEKSGEYVFGNSGSLGIYTDAIDYFGVGSDKTWMINQVNSSAVTGEHFGENIELICKNYSEQLNKIKENYVAGLDDTLYALYDMTKTEFYQGKMLEADEYYSNFESLYANVEEEIEKFKSEANKFALCSENLSEIVDNITNTIHIGAKAAKEYRRLINNQLISIDPNNNDSKYDADREISNKLKEKIEEDIVAIEEWKNYISKFNFGEQIKDTTCEGILGPDLLDDISTILTWIRIAVPIILIVLGSVDFARAVLSDDQQELKKATSRFTKRCIIAVAIFFVPSIIMYLISFIDKIADVSCDIRLW